MTRGRAGGAHRPGEARAARPGLRGLIDTFSVMYPQLYTLDFRESATRLEVPVYMLDGAAELDGRRSHALAWFEAAAHSVAFEQADEVLRLLNETVVPATYGVTSADRTP